MTSIPVTEYFELLQSEEIAELNATAHLYRHQQTGAEVLSIENDDENKVFGITFRTPPPDSTGVAHILEHSVLCGSRKYPLKEPFVELIKGSLNTFLNAFTYPDKTCYPVASQNVQDFYNLIDVYLDAVFYPRITPQIFAQEGWHYELQAPDDPLVFKGVVFNEMKGAYGSPDGLLLDYAQQSLFPDTPYGVDSGGDPRHIPDLTYEQFKNFHQTLYHPSNARIFFYGDDDPETRLHIINEYLNEFQRIEIDSSVPLQARFDAPRHSVYTYRVDDDSDTNKSQMTVNWLLSEANDPQAMLAFTILDHILLETPASPLRKALLDSGLGEDLAGSGFVDHLRQSYFSVGLKGISASDADKVETLILRTLEDVVEQGIDPDTVEAAMNTVEFLLRENNTGRAPRGLVAMIRALNTWLHDDDPLTMLKFEAPLTAIKEQLAAGERYFENLIGAGLLDNTHRTTTILNPDPEQGKREAEQEKARLEEARAAMGQEQLQAVITQTEELQRMQETPDPPEALATIPSLTLNDLELKNKEIPCTHYTQQDVKVLYHDLPTSGITYLDVGMNLRILPQDLLPYASIFAAALLELGTTRETDVQLAQRIGRKTGGISTSKFSSAIQDTQDTASWLFLRGKATPEQTTEMLTILRDVLLTVKLDNRERFRQIVLETKASKEASIVPAGHGMVAMRLRSCFNTANWAEEQMSGINFLFFLRRLIEEIDQDWPGVLAKLEQVRQTLVNRAAMICNVTSEEPVWKQFQTELDSFLAELPATPAVPVDWIPDYNIGFEGLTIPSQVNYVGKGANLYSLGYESHGSAAVITNYLFTSWLWEQIRVKGGAYGGFCRFDRLSGIFTYLSYRDPNLLDTLRAYDKTSEFLRQVELDDTAVARSIIGTIGSIDAYQLPDAKGFASLVRYLTGTSDELLQQVRDEVLSTTTQHFRDFADVLDQVQAQGLVVVLGSNEAINAANDAFKEAGDPPLHQVRVL